MILGFKHKGLRRLFEEDRATGVSPAHADKLRDILTALNAATRPGHMDLPGFRLHPLKGARAGVWAVTVSGNWRVTFRFDGDGNAIDADYLDYH